MTESERSMPRTYRYFMIRVDSGDERRPRLTGVIEWMTTGEKRRFTNRDELLRLLEDWSGVPAEGPSSVTRGPDVTSYGGIS